MKNIFRYTTGALILGLFIACNPTKKQDDTTQTVQKPEKIQLCDFNKDSAYNFVSKQVEFGPRVPNTKAHKDCAKFLINTLGQYVDTLIVQDLSIKAYNGTLLHGQNIIGVFNPEARKRILLSAHWDSRPYADHDPNPDNRRTPIDGANDGASGVGVLLEIARQLQINSPQIGVDIIFFDLEDYGEPNDERDLYQGENWCLGSQSWAKNPHIKNYRAQYGILLDMVGNKNAQFTKEGISREFAPDILDNIWSRANMLGFSSYFKDIESNHITDDHLYVNIIRNIPCIDIIEFNLSSGTGFFKYWHTVNDNMSNIDKETLFAVGTVVLSVVYSEK